MYESFFGFNEKPFSLLPDPAFLFFTKKHRMALTMFEYGLANQAGFTVITGEIGSGKTTLIRKLLQEDDVDLTVGLVTNTKCANAEELLRWILFAFSLDYSGKSNVGLFQTFSEFVVSEYAAGRRVAIIVDEAQELGAALLEQLRMLSNINVDKHQVVQFILVGQPNLRELLRQPELEQFAQRVVVDYHLEALQAEETVAYIRHRLSVVGGNPELFSEPACRLIWSYGRGIPRLINTLCDTSLVYAFSEQQATIDLKLVKDVLADKQTSLAPLGLGPELSVPAPANGGLSRTDSPKAEASETANEQESKQSMIERLFGD